MLRGCVLCAGCVALECVISCCFGGGLRPRWPQVWRQRPDYRALLESDPRLRSVCAGAREPHGRRVGFALIEWVDTCRHCWPSVSDPSSFFYFFYFFRKVDWVGSARLFVCECCWRYNWGFFCFGMELFWISWDCASVSNGVTEESGTCGTDFSWSRNAAGTGAAWIFGIPAWRSSLKWNNLWFRGAVYCFWYTTIITNCPSLGTFLQ